MTRFQIAIYLKLTFFLTDQQPLCWGNCSHHPFWTLQIWACFFERLWSCHRSFGLCKTLGGEIYNFSRRSKEDCLTKLLPFKLEDLWYKLPDVVGEEWSSFNICENLFVIAETSGHFRIQQANKYGNVSFKCCIKSNKLTDKHPQWRGFAPISSRRSYCGK